MGVLHWIQSVLVFTIVVETTKPNPACATQMRSIKLATMMERNSEELLRTYVSRQGFFQNSCTGQVEGIPEALIAGDKPEERLLSMYTTLRVLHRLFITVREQQKDLLESDDPLRNMLLDAQTRVTHLTGNLKIILTNVFPGVAIPPEHIPVPQPKISYFKKKLYGCRVLTKYNEFLSKVVQELTDIRKYVCTAVEIKLTAKINLRLRFHAFR
ncbi:IL-6 subfamily cytokine M17 isoform X2 [Amia ocellicauda]|uniref:IL-6 subfamily cytokine M17 isoform X2 n=1 Tax=Amia ocellicauda TaxID=2972642 RepID=UPI003464974C